MIKDNIDLNQDFSLSCDLHQSNIINGKNFFTHQAKSVIVLQHTFITHLGIFDICDLFSKFITFSSLMTWFIYMILIKLLVNKTWHLFDMERS